MSSKVQAAFVEAFHKPLALREWGVPTPGIGQILVEAEARWGGPHRPACRTRRQQNQRPRFAMTT